MRKTSRRAVEGDLLSTAQAKAQAQANANGIRCLVGVWVAVVGTNLGLCVDDRSKGRVWVFVL